MQHLQVYYVLTLLARIFIEMLTLPHTMLLNIRVGGRERYFHCKTCNCCYAIELQDSHICIENSMHHNCPVCFEYLFESIKPIHVMPCGHTIHEASILTHIFSCFVHDDYDAYPPFVTQACLQQLLEHRTSVCPVCFKSYM